MSTYTPMLKRTFCWLYDSWLSKVVGTKEAPVVRLLDFVAGSECKYCMGVRCLMIGIGLGLFNLIGAGLIALALFLTLGEKLWLCDK